MVSFNSVADEYDRARPGYPDALFDALEPLPDGVVIEGGAGTGIATEALANRGARVIGFDIGDAILRRLRARDLGVGLVVADGAAMPFRDGCTRLLCFAQSWHWLDPTKRATEAARVLVDNGRWAGWWSHPWSDGEPWFEAYWRAIERARPGTRDLRSIDWGADLDASRQFVVHDRQTFPWTRTVSIDSWLTDERSKSYVATLEHHARRKLLDEIEGVLRLHFPDGAVTARYETWLWQAHKR
jgi:SAM-dependent methyltransferase